MHQPYYVDPVSRTAMMPWVRLHAVKGYLDMISTVEEFPDIRVNFNLTPVLLLQLVELTENTVRDLWLDWASKPADQLEEHEKVAILENFFKIHWDNLIKPFPRYWELLNKRGLVFDRQEVRRGIRYWSVQDFTDLQTWFNLAWCGYTAEQMFPELAAYKQKGRLFTEGEKQRVLAIHQEIIRKIIPLYRAAEERGQIEITTTPFFHPILPLVYDSDLAKRCMPERSFPRRFHWPEDALAQLRMAVHQHRKLFGKAPRGLWPSEGSIAPELVPLMRAAGIQYFCSDEENLFRSLARDPAFLKTRVDHLEMFQAWNVEHEGARVQAVFREKSLSDFIGFMAAKNRTEEAAAHLLFHLRNIARALPPGRGMIPLILDGENAWETFADGGRDFLRAVYAGVLKDKDLQSTTLEDSLAQEPPSKTVRLLHTGSWIASDFDIWIGEEEENRAWDILGDTRSFLQSQIDSARLSPDQQEAALREIYAAEGSDWFWWYGPDFSTENDPLFDDLFRQHLKNVYHICGELPPAQLEAPITATQAPPLYTPPERPVSRNLLGRRFSYFDWSGAGCYVAGSEQGAMYQSGRVLKQFFFGNDSEFLYLRLDPLPGKDAAVRVEFHGTHAGSIELGSLRKTRPSSLLWIGADGACVECQGRVSHDVLELALPLSLIKCNGDSGVRFQVKIYEGKFQRECYPERVPVEFGLTRNTYMLESWMV